MSEQMAVSDNTTGEEDSVTTEDSPVTTAAEPTEVVPETPVEPAKVEDAEALPTPMAVSALPSDSPPPEVDPEEQGEPAEPVQVKEELQDEELDIPVDSIKEEPEMDIKTEDEEMPEQIVTYEENGDDKRGTKRRASSAFSDHDAEEFKGFDDIKQEIITGDYNRILERLQAEVTAATEAFVPLKTVMATPPIPARANKRPRKDTDGSRPSSALSSRSDGDGTTDASSAAQSPASRGGRRATTEMSSPLLRIPLERGWKRELVYRAALDMNARRNADIYYYTPQGKKLRSTREVAEHLSGTGLTLENFSFFKEPLGVDDPEKEIIRDAKLIRRVDSPIAATTPATPVEGKRTPKPKMPKGASPEPQQNATQAAAALKSPAAKIKVKSMGSRLSNSNPAPALTPAPAPAALKEKQQPQQKKPPPAAITPDNNNTSAWKKPRPPPVQPPQAPSAQPPPLVSRPPDVEQHPRATQQSPRQLVQPCSMTCGRGVPTLSCAACLCLYHAACAGYLHAPPPNPFLCKNCRKSSSPPLEPPPLTHKSGITAASPSVPVPVPVPVAAPVPRRVPKPVPVPAKVPKDKRVLLRMKVSGGTPDGERVWAVSDTQSQPQSVPQPQKPTVQPAQPSTAAGAGRARSLPQSLAVLNGRRFIIVPRSVIHTHTK